jgi:hypothetical protein
MQAYNYPFSYLCKPGTSNITLAINDHDSKYDDYLIAPGSTPLQPLYGFHYSKKRDDGSYDVEVDHYGHMKRHVGSIRFYQNDPPEMSFPWLR